MLNQSITSAVTLYQCGTLTFQQAANMSGTDMITFNQCLRHNGASIGNGVGDSSGSSADPVSTNQCFSD